MEIYDMVFHYSVQAFFHMEMEKQDALEGKRNKFLTSPPHLPTSRSDTAHLSHQKQIYTYHNVPSTSKTMPFSGGAEEALAICGLRGANRFGDLPVWLVIA